MFYLTTHSTHFINCYMVSDIWLRTILIVRKETRCQHIGYSYRLTARVLLYAPSHRQDNTYHSLCYTSHGALAGTRTQREVIEVKIRRCCKGCENRLLKNNRWHHFMWSDMNEWIFGQIRFTRWRKQMHFLLLILWVSLFIKVNST